MSEPFPVLQGTGDDVHVWWIALDEIGNDAAAVLAPDEIARAARLRHERDRHRWQGARAALREILAGYAGVSAAALRFRRGPWGKPELESGMLASARGTAGSGPASGGTIPLRFNLAHAGERAALAVAWQREVGIDLEPLDPALDLTPLIATVCTPAEAVALRALPAGERVSRLLTLWTVKEAFLKGTGEGLARDPRAIEATLGADGSASLRDRDTGAPVTDWHLLRLAAGAGWTATVAVAARQVTVREFRWPQAIVNDRAIAS